MKTRLKFLKLPSQNLQTSHNFYQNKSQNLLMLDRLVSMPNKRKTCNKRNKFSEFIYHDDRTFFNINIENIKKDLYQITEKSNVLPIIINIPKKIFIRSDNQKNKFRNDEVVDFIKLCSTNRNQYMHINENLKIPMIRRIKSRKIFNHSNCNKKEIKNSIDSFNISGSKAIKHYRVDFRESMKKNTTNIFKTNIEINQIPKNIYLFKRKKSFSLFSSLINLHKYLGSNNYFTNSKIRETLSKLSPNNKALCKNKSKNHILNIIKMDNLQYTSKDAIIQTCKYNKLSG